MWKPKGSFRSEEEYKYYRNNSRLCGSVPLFKTPVTNTELHGASATRFDVFGSLFPDIQIIILGYVAASRPGQVVVMKMVSKRWNEILSQDEIYSSALLTTSFSPPPKISREAFEQAAFTDDRLRRMVFAKIKTFKLLDNPGNVIYRDGFLVWWSAGHKGFNYVDLNKTYPSSKKHTILTKPVTFSERPLYASGGGVLVYQESCLVLHMVRLREPSNRGRISLPHSRDLDAPLELYCSDRFVLVLRGLELLVIEITESAKGAKILCVIPLQQHTHLLLPIVNTIEISNKRCLVVLTSNDSLEALSISLTTGSLIKRYSTKSPLESRAHAHQYQAIYHVKNSREFGRDTQYQVQNITHKKGSLPFQPPSADNDCSYRWLQLSGNERDHDECVTGSYIAAPARHARHCVAFEKQGISFSAFLDPYTVDSVAWHSLEFRTGFIGAEVQDHDLKGLDLIASFSHHSIGNPRRVSRCFSPAAQIAAPPNCYRMEGDSYVYDYDRWAECRNDWPRNGTLLGDEKALILLLPHQLIVWKFQTLQMWRDRKKNSRKWLVRDGVQAGLIGAAVFISLFPFSIFILPMIYFPGKKDEVKERGTPGTWNQPISPIDE